jgi:sn-glycerol 3-phosphate transport system permease protein
MQNFISLLVSSEYHRSVLHSFVFSFGVTFLALALSLFLATLANQKIMGLPFYRTAVLWTYGIAPPVSGIIWLFIFHPSYGILTYVLSMVTTYEFNWLLQGWIAMLLPVTFFLFIMNMVFSFFETFGIIHAVTQGGPGDATTIMVYKTYLDGFVNMRIGTSAAQSVILMALVIFLTVLQFRYAERKVFY